MPMFPRARSMTQRTIWKVALRIGIVVVAATVLSYWHIRAGLEEQALEQLETYVEQRQVRESHIFQLASEDLSAFAKAYAQRLKQSEGETPGRRFEELFETRSDGTTRVRERWFAQEGITGLIGKHVEIDDDLRRRLVLAFDVLAQFGPAWRSRFVNLYVITPENAVLMYWPDQPWALQASDWEVHGKLSLVAGEADEVIVVGEDRLAGERAWSDLYFDYGVNDWMVSAIEPVNRDGRHLLSVGHDILLHDLIERALTSGLEGTYNLIFREDGRLIAHPRLMEAIQAQSGALSIADAGDPHLERIFELAQQRPADQIVVENEADAEILAVSQLNGPGWYLVTVFPHAIIGDRAFRTARLILVLGAIALLFEIGVLYLVLNKQVTRPLTSLIRATRQLSSGRLDAELAVERSDEIGQLARSFNIMAKEIDAREAALSERSQRLAEVNAQLARELEERKRAEREIARQREVLHQSEKLNALGSLLAGVAHELNNPLTVVVGRSSMLEEQFRGTPQGASIAKIRSAAERCAKIIKTFLAMARHQPPSRAPVRVGELVRASLDIVGYGLRREGVELRIEVPDDLPEILADPAQLTQVFTNLLVNAQQALADAPAPRRVAVEADFDPEAMAITVRVRDNGPGIPPEIVARVFEPFFTTKPVGQGTGLGLSVCRGLIEAHGGSIDVRAAEDGGTTFVIRVPVQDGTAVPAREDQTPALPPQRRILVVEDEPEIARMLVEVLEAQGHKVEMAATGRIALERLAHARFDLVLSDLRMPDVDGRQLFTELEALDPGLAARVVFVTGDSLSDAVRGFLGESGRPLIEKPFTPEEVRRIVAGQLALADGGGRARPPVIVAA